MSAVRESLGKVLDTPGTRMATIVDIGTGMVIASAGDGIMDLHNAAASLVDEARWAVRTHGQEGVDTASLALVTGRGLYLTKILEYRRGDGVLLYVDVDLSQTNIALVTWQIDQLAPELLAS